MEYTAIRTKIESILKEVAHSAVPVSMIITEISQLGGRPLLVGGAVRDLLLGLPVKDIDIEIHNLEPKKLEHILKKFGPVESVGKSFGVFKIHGVNADWSLPRSDDTAGRHPTVTVDPYLSLQAAFRRRDLTMNAMGIDLVTFELIDPFNGQRDMKDHVLRTPDPTFFVQDPLRFFRVMQFIARFEMAPDDQLNSICRTMDIADVSIERIEAEFQKLFFLSKNPSRAIRWLEHIGRLSEVMPELADTIGVMQEPRWHPEGDVFEHTMQSIDAAARLTYENNEQKLQLMYAALCHDLGKTTTTIRDKGILRSPGHAQAGVPLARSLLRRISRNETLREVVEKLVDNHMAPGQLVEQNSSPAAYKRLAQKLAPQATLQMLALLKIADRQGRNPRSSIPLNDPDPEVEQFLAQAERLNILYEAEKPLLLGRDIADLVSPGPKMGKLLHYAYEMQIERGIKDKEELKRLIQQKLEHD